MKKLMILAAIFMVQLAQAKDYVLVVKTQKPIRTGKTEIRENSDTLEVTPDKGISIIHVEVSDAEGTPITQDIMPASIPSNYLITTPSLPTGSLLKIRDDNEVVFEKCE